MSYITHALKIDYPVFAIKDILRGLCSLQFDSPFYCVLDTTLLGTQFQLADYLTQVRIPRNLHIIELVSLQKLHQDGLELTMGGALTVYSAHRQDHIALMEQLRQLRDIIGARMGVRSAMLLDTGGLNETHIRAHTARIHKNTLTLAQAFNQLIVQQKGSACRVIYPGLPQHPDHAIAVEQYRSYGPFLFFDAGSPTMNKRFVSAFSAALARAGIIHYMRDSFGFQHLSICSYYGGAYVRISCGSEDTHQMTQIVNALQTVVRGLPVEQASPYSSYSTVTQSAGDRANVHKLIQQSN